MCQTHDDEINQGDCPREEGSGVRPVRHWEMPLLEPPERDKDGQESEADDGAQKAICSIVGRIAEASVRAPIASERVWKMPAAKYIKRGNEE